MLRTKMIQIASVPIAGWIYGDSVLSPHCGTSERKNSEPVLYGDHFISLMFTKVSALLSRGQRTGQGHGKKQLVRMKEEERKKED